MSMALSEASQTLIALSTDTFRKWFKGSREPQPDVWAKASEMDEVAFSRGVASALNEKNLPTVVAAFGIHISPEEEIDKFAFTGALAIQFKAIAKGNGQAENMMEEHYRSGLDASEFPAYIEKAKNKYSKMKTLLYSSEERPFRDFFVCNSVTSDLRHAMMSSRYLHDEDTIEYVSVDKLAKRSPYCLLIGMGGIGKSMMMRHLFLGAMAQYPKTGKLPIMATLREFGTETKELFDIIVDSVHRFDITFTTAHAHKLLSEGKCILLLDGLDEIKASDMQSFQKQLDALLDQYPDNQCVMSTRRFSSFVEYQRFALLAIMPFSQAQAVELIDKLEFCPEEPKLKKQFKERLITEYFESHAEFVKNPLLLTLMLMNYRRFCDVPEKQHLFYEQAYDTLLQRHDHDKIAYRRVFRSVNDPSDFTMVFREFCAKSYRKGDYEFDRKRFDEYFGKLKSIERQDPSIMKADNFLFDICHSVCMMYEEGLSYHFLHRSFQEYFFADYYSRQDDDTLRKLGRFMHANQENQFDRGIAYSMLYDLAPEKVERFIIMPFLETIFEDKEDKEAYWLFLSECYVCWFYSLLDKEALKKKGIDTKRDHVLGGRLVEGVESSSPILDLILEAIRFGSDCYVNPVDEEFQYPELEKESYYGIVYPRKHIVDDETRSIIRLMPLPKEVLNETGAHERFGEDLLKDDAGEPLVIGRSYVFPFDLGATEPEKYKNIVDLFEAEDCPTMKAFVVVKAFYEKLKITYAAATDMDDDDF